MKVCKNNNDERESLKGFLLKKKYIFTIYIYIYIYIEEDIFKFRTISDSYNSKLIFWIFKALN